MDVMEPTDPSELRSRARIEGDDVEDDIELANDERLKAAERSGGALVISAIDGNKAECVRSFFNMPEGNPYPMLDILPDCGGCDSNGDEWVGEGGCGVDDGVGKPRDDTGLDGTPPLLTPLLPRWTK